ncbi:lytic murein transglycosylase B [Herbaspirillum sp. LeCh32-8]|uniref:lytic murein transglycosylase B n=1 Tax=Herbaspirillum sp. LeCh32-8 TaxID=2821356 RepID=UPI001AE18DF0|nr:lytic murein transglycosylase B [Herbaspirillum sp. LeCh32-8]MBP0598729.1 lytic murein transglycosylase B [Herbaspirillum sp. LeCh32-8]
MPITLSRLTSLPCALPVALLFCSLCALPPAAHAQDTQTGKAPSKNAPANKTAKDKKTEKKSDKKSGQKTGKNTDKKDKKPQAKKKVAPEDQGEFVNFNEWKEVARFIDEMVERNGFERSKLNALFAQTRYLDTAIQLIKPAPSTKPKNWAAYRARFIDATRINAGVEFWNTYGVALARAEAQYGVPMEIIVGIIGVETVYGRNTGSFRVMDAITTLAFDYPNTPTREARMAFFRGELENTLLLARDENIDPMSLRGSYAGAVGWPQFMPGSIREYAVDFDGDGKIDLRNSPVDAIGSVAHYLAVHGWQRGEPVAFPVTVSADNQQWQGMLNQGLEAKYTQDQMQAAGISGPALPAGMRFGLVDLQNGTAPTEYWMATNNFYAITQYNRSYFYAMSVAELGRAVAAARNRQPAQ